MTPETIQSLRRLAEAATPGLEWIKHDPEASVYDGSWFAGALQVTDNETGKTRWDIHTFAVTCDEGVFNLTWTTDGDSGDAFTSWGWEDFEYLIPLNDSAELTVKGFKHSNPTTILNLLDEIELANRKLEKAKAALAGLMEAHRQVFGSSLFAGFSAGRSEFIGPWKKAEDTLAELEGK